MTALAFLAADLLGVAVLTLVLYLPRHHRRDLTVALLGVNVGVLAVTAALASTSVGAGLGMGLFGVLSIIRLRSSELAQHEVAYYFAALALGLLGGLAPTPAWFGLALMALVVGVLALVDHPRVLAGERRRLFVLDRAFDDETALRAHLEQRIGGRVVGMDVQKVDHVNDTTLVEARWVDGPTPVQPAALTADERTEVAAWRR